MDASNHNAENFSFVCGLLYVIYSIYTCGLPTWCSSKESACNVGDLGSIPGLGRSPGEGNGNPLQYSFLENSMDRRAWQAMVHGVAKSLIQLSN